MSNEVHKKRIGLFLIIGFVCLFGLIGKFIITSIMPNNSNLFVMFFNESVKGLSVGSSVVLEGVEVGKVTRIALVANPETLAFSIPVFVRFTQDNRTSPVFKTMTRSYRNREQIIGELIKKGMRARLVTQNLLTGQLMIELVMLPDTPVNFVKTPETEGLLQIPTVLSTIGELSKGIQDLPLKQMVITLNAILNDVQGKLPVILPEIAQLGSNLNKAVPTYTALGESLQQTVPAINAAGETINTVGEKMEKTLGRIDNQLSQTTQTMNHFNETLNDIGAAARSLRNLTDYLERQPESLLRGKGKQ